MARGAAPALSAGRTAPPRPAGGPDFYTRGSARALRQADCVAATCRRPGLLPTGPRPTGSPAASTVTRDPARGWAPATTARGWLQGAVVVGGGLAGGTGGHTASSTFTTSATPHPARTTAFALPALAPIPAIAWGGYGSTNCAEATCDFTSDTLPDTRCSSPCVLPARKARVWGSVYDHRTTKRIRSPGQSCAHKHVCV